MTLYAATSEEKFRFDNPQQQWVKIGQPPLANGRVLAVAPDNSILYAATSEGVFWSADRGQSWTAPTDKPDIWSLLLDSTTNALYTVPYDRSEVYRSGDKGETWQPAGSWPQPKPFIHSLALVTARKLLFAGTTRGLFRNRARVNNPVWQPVEETSRLEIYTLAWDPQGGVIYAGTSSPNLVFRYKPGGEWQEIRGNLPGDINGIHFLAVDWQRGVLYAAASHDNRVWWISTNQTALAMWSASHVTRNHNQLTALRLDTTTGILYAGTAENGVFRSQDQGQSWQRMDEGLPRAVSIVSLGDESSVEVKAISPTLPLQQQIYQPYQQQVSQEALERLIEEDRENAKETGKVYPSRQENPFYAGQTGLPSLLRTWLPPSRVPEPPPPAISPDLPWIGPGPPPVPSPVPSAPEFLPPLSPAPNEKPETTPLSPPILELLTPTQIEAVFGLQPEDHKKLEAELVPGPVIGLERPATGLEKPDRLQPLHFTWHQVYNKNGRSYPVLGGSVRVHAALKDERIAVTNSYLPIPADYPFASDLQPEEEPLSPRLTLEEAGRQALEAVAEKLRRIHTVTADDGKRGLWGIAETMYPAEWFSAYKLGVDKWRKRHYQTFIANLVNVIKAVNQITDPQGTIFAGDKLKIPFPVEFITVAPTKFAGESDYAILPFSGAYYLISRFRAQSPGQEPWFVEVDMKSGQVGQPWQALLTLPATFYQTSRETRNNTPTGNIAGLLNLTYKDADNQDVKYVETLKRHWPQIENFLNSNRSEQTTIAAQALHLFKYLIDICHVPPAAFANRTLQVKLVSFNNNKVMGFSYGDDELKLTFWEDVATVDGKPIHNAARDPEVALHEFTHLFLWLLNPDPWGTLADLERNPFGRALHEGYAMYLPRSIIARQQASEVDQPWASAAYRDWGDRWAPVRDKFEEGADFLPAPNVYPRGEFSTTDAGHYRAYDAGMIWARALWELRELVEPEHADWLIVQSYFYLHGHIVNFELAAEALFDADIRLTNNLKLSNGTLPIWARRNIVAGHSIHGFAQIGNTIIAAGDTGIIVSTDGGSSWQPDASGAIILNQITAVAASNNNFYAATQQNGVYQKAVAGQGSAGWQLVSGPDLSKQLPLNITLQSLLALEDGRLVVGANQGVYVYTTEDGWRPGGLEGAIILGLAQGQTATQKFVQAYTAEKLYKIDLDTLFQPAASIATASSGTGVAGGGFGGFGGFSTTVAAAATAETPQWGLINFGPRFTALATRNQTSIYAGTLNGLRRIVWDDNNNFTDNAIAAIPATVVLAVTAKGNTVYCATPAQLFKSQDGVNFTDVGYQGFPSTTARIISLFATANGKLLLGTLAHGIWQRNGTIWKRVYPVAPDDIELAPDETGLLTVALQSQNNLLISMPRQITLLKIAQPGLPRNPIEFNRQPDQNLNKYDLSASPKAGQIILKLKNTDTISYRLEVVVSNNVISLIKI